MKNLLVQKNLRKIILLLSLSFLALSVYQVTQHWNYQETLADLDLSIRHSVTKKSLLKEIKNAIDENEFDDARTYLAIAQSSHYSQKVFSNDSSNGTSNLKPDLDAISFQSLKIEIEQKDTKFRQIISQAGHFTKGFIKGKGANVAGVAGSVVADFTVIGDARDLTREYGKYQKGENINELIVLLSGAGVGLTALTIGTRGTAAPAKVGASVIKVAVKTQRLTRSFQNYLLKLGRQVFDWPTFTRVIKNNKSVSNIRRAAKQAYHPKAIKPLERIAKRVNNIRKSTSTMDTVHLLKYIDSPKDLIQLEKVSLKYGLKTKGMMKLLGKGALRTVRVLQKTTKLLLSLLSSLLSGMFSLFLLFARKNIR